MPFEGNKLITSLLSAIFNNAVSMCVVMSLHYTAIMNKSSQMYLGRSGRGLFGANSRL
jgi:hypothetical protein